MVVHENFSLKKYNTFGMNVSSKYFVEMNSDEDILQLLSERKFRNCDKLVIGSGSNILFTKNFNGLIIALASSAVSVIEDKAESVLVTARAGVVWHDLVLFCLDRNYGGIENLSLIPGKAGAAPIQNIGAYGQELKDVFYSLKGINIDDSKQIVMHKSECKFGYRNSVFKNELKNKIIVTEITLKLDKSPKLNIDYGAIREELDKLNKSDITIKDVSSTICKIRKSKLPDPQLLGNAGSFFKNPEVTTDIYFKLKEKFPDLNGYKISDDTFKIPAAWLIEKGGFKGKRFGNAGVHEKQALVIVNYGDALPHQVVELKEKIKSEIFQTFKINLIEEVIII